MGLLEWLAIGWAGATVVCLGFLATRARRRGRAVESALANGAWHATAGHAALLPITSRELSVEREFGAALAAVRELAAGRLVELQVAIQHGLVVWSDPYVLRQILTEILTLAIDRAPEGGILLCAHWHGGRVHTTITDDGPPGDPALLRGALRRVEETVALQGGTLEIACSVTRGNVVTLRLPGVGEPLASPMDDGAVEQVIIPQMPRSRAVRSPL